MRAVSQILCMLWKGIVGMKGFRIGVRAAMNNRRKMQGDPMLRIKHYNKAWWRSRRKDVEKFVDRNISGPCSREDLLVLYGMMNCSSVRIVE